MVFCFDLVVVVVNIAITGEKMYQSYHYILSTYTHAYQMRIGCLEGNKSRGSLINIININEGDIRYININEGPLLGIETQQL